MPDSPLQALSQFLSTPVPRGVTKPSPVTTTLLIGKTSLAVTHPNKRNSRSAWKLNGSWQNAGLRFEFYHLVLAIALLMGMSDSSPLP